MTREKLQAKYPEWVICPEGEEDGLCYAEVTGAEDVNTIVWVRHSDYAWCVTSEYWPIAYPQFVLEDLRR